VKNVKGLAGASRPRKEVLSCAAILLVRGMSVPVVVLEVMGEEDAGAKRVGVLVPLDSLD